MSECGGEVGKLVWRWDEGGDVSVQGWKNEYVV